MYRDGLIFVLDKLQAKSTDSTPPEPRQRLVGTDSREQGYMQRTLFCASHVCMPCFGIKFTVYWGGGSSHTSTLIVTAARDAISLPYSGAENCASNCPETSTYPSCDIKIITKKQNYAHQKKSKREKEDNKGPWFRQFS
eukprot:gene8181-5708_t